MIHNSSHWRQDNGRLDINVSNRSSGKKLIEWVFIAPMENRQEKKILIEVSLSQDLKLTARIPEINHKIEDTDIESLARRVQNYLQESIPVFQDIDWEDWLEVKLSGSNSPREEKRSAWGQEILIQVSKIKRGTNKTTGKVFCLNVNGLLTPFPESKQFANSGETTSFLSGSISLTSSEETAYIKATPENLAALDTLMEKMNELRSRLCDLLSQETIQINLDGALMKLLK